MRRAIIALAFTSTPSELLGAACSGFVLRVFGPLAQARYDRSIA